MLEQGSQHPPLAFVRDHGHIPHTIIYITLPLGVQTGGPTFSFQQGLLLMLMLKVPRLWTSCNFSFFFVFVTGPLHYSLLMYLSGFLSLTYSEQVCWVLALPAQYLAGGGGVAVFCLSWNHILTDLQYSPGSTTAKWISRFCT